MAQSAKARRSAAEAQAVLNFFQDQVLAAARPRAEGGLGKDVTIRRRGRRRAKIATSFRDQPTVEASIRYAGYDLLLSRRTGAGRSATSSAPRTAQRHARPRPPRHPQKPEQPRPGLQETPANWTEAIPLFERDPGGPRRS